MRIGILTFHRALNYGAFLQAYALRRTILEMGHQAEVVDYWPDGHAAAYALFPPLRWWKIRPLWMNVKSLAYSCLALFPAWKRKRKMRSLWCRYLNLPPKPLYRKSGELGALQYDCLCYGSDQIWWKSVIPGYEGFDEVYWGVAVPQGVRKVAYAPSMGGISLTGQDRERIGRFLLNFDALAVRETALRDALSPLTVKKIEVVLDPVFLMEPLVPSGMQSALYFVLQSPALAGSCGTSASFMRCVWMYAQGGYRPDRAFQAGNDADS